MVSQFPSDVNETKCHVKNNRCGGGNGGDNGRPCLMVELVPGGGRLVGSWRDQSFGTRVADHLQGRGELLKITGSKNFVPSLRNDHTDLAQQGRVKVTAKEMTAGQVVGQSWC